jgi:hypothetical protein
MEKMRNVKNSVMRFIDKYLTRKVKYSNLDDFFDSPTTPSRSEANNSNHNITQRVSLLSIDVPEVIVSEPNQSPIKSTTSQDSNKKPSHLLQFFSRNTAEIHDSPQCESSPVLVTPSNTHSRPGRFQRFFLALSLFSRFRQQVPAGSPRLGTIS